MEELIQLNTFPIKEMLKTLLKDKTTKKNIIWATDSYLEFGKKYEKDRQITISTLKGFDSINIQPRVTKSLQSQQTRTKTRAEVFTPSWICNQMNNYCDEDWFGRKNVFNIENDKSWETIHTKIEFKNDKEWKKYIDLKKLEITCGEAPFLVSRYDTTSGKYIEVENRIGALDRKLRVINENTSNEQDWFKWVIRAYQSTYGYEFQGDNLLIARINLLMTFVENYKYKWNKEPKLKDIKSIANIIIWNIWQMDGLTNKTPFKTIEENRQLSLFDDENNNECSKFCKIYDWRSKKAILFKDLKGN